MAIGQPRAVVFNILKGGQTKTTLSINTTERLAARGHDVCYVDLDPNGHGTVGLGLEAEYEERDYNIGDVIIDGTHDFEDVVIQTKWGFDAVPSHDDLDDVRSDLESATMSDVRLKQLANRLLGDRYDYMIFDTSAARSKLTDNAYVAAENVIIPARPENETINGIRQTLSNQIEPMREFIDIDIMAIVPNRIEDRIDQDRPAKRLLKGLNTHPTFAKYVPEFARIDEDEWSAIENGASGPLPKPGIRKRDAFSDAWKEGMPLAAYDPENDQLEHLDELATIVENGGVIRDA